MQQRTRMTSLMIIGLVALLVVVTAVAVGWRMVKGDNSLLRNVTVEKDTITPNADGDNDATLVTYEISRNATVSIYFENDAGERFYFREAKQRGAGPYRVLFSGVVDGYHLPGDEMVAGEIIDRLLQNGTYTWTIEAVDDEGVTEREQGTITIADADTQLPLLRDFTLDKDSFTPNRDGIDDRLLIQFYLTKAVDKLRVFLVEDGQEVPISELERDVPANQPGRHYYDYEGGVDNGATPPPDGAYPIVAIAEDLEGQKVRVEDEITIAFGGVPRADIFAPPNGETVKFNVTAVPLCDTLQFTLTVENYGNTPIRTTGPAPGTVYDSDWNYNTLGWHTESGAWRVAIGYENELATYPYRWAVGHREDLEKIGDHYYLMPGERAVVTGGIRITGPLGERNPQPMWAGLIHEDVEISQFNNRVDPQSIQIDLPDEENVVPCDPRQIPRR